jgi:hypothetical protein
MSHDIKGDLHYDGLHWGMYQKSMWTIGSTVGKICTSCPLFHISSFVSPEKHFSGYLTSQNLVRGGIF